MAGRNVAERLGRIGIAAVDGEAEKITGQRKSDDLPAAVRQRLVKAHDTFGHDMDGFGRFVLIDERRLVLGVDSVPEIAQHGEFGAVQRAADAELLHRAVQADAFARSAGRARHDAGARRCGGGLQPRQIGRMFERCRMTRVVRTDRIEHCDPLSAISHAATLTGPPSLKIRKIA